MTLLANNELIKLSGKILYLSLLIRWSKFDILEGGKADDAPRISPLESMVWVRSI
jgi:hypothetical protein